MKKSFLCKGCSCQLGVPIVLQGPLSIPFKLLGLKRSRMNPNICTMCEKYFAKMARFSKAGKTQKQAKTIVVPSAVLFVDIRGYTNLSESIDPSVMTKLLGQFYESIATVVWEHDGIINNIIGDAMLAVFNWPIIQDDYIEQAVQAGITMQKKWLEIQSKVDDQRIENEHASIGVGISIGDISVGELSDICKDYTYTVFGPVVNLASRLQGRARSGEIVIAQDAYEQLSEQKYEAEKDVYTLKGISESVTAYRINVRE